ncbi:hypothetical protein BH09SUM1_BH09SUM1_07290 [soil metagenome]
MRSTTAAETPRESRAPAPAPAERLAIVIPSENPQPGRDSLRRTLSLVGIATFATTFGNPLVIGSIPFSLTLKDDLGVGPLGIAMFFLTAAIFWYLKPLIGLAIDRTVPRQSFARALVVFAIVAEVVWVVIAFVPASYASLLLGAISLNGAIAAASSIAGGLVVESGQAHSATGRTNAASMSLRHVGYIGAGLLSGYLAVWPIGILCRIGAATMAILAISALILAPKKTEEATAPAAETFAWRQIFASRPLMMVALMAFLLEVAPGFNTPLLFLQRDVLHFGPEFLGWLTVVASVAGIAGALLYTVLCKRMSIYAILVVTIALEAMTTMGYLFYSNADAAIVLTLLKGVATTLALMPILDLAARATPRLVACGGFALIMSVQRLSTHLSDVSGSWLTDHFAISFPHLVWINAITSLAIIAVIPFIPAVIAARREGEQTPATA